MPCRLLPRRLRRRARSRRRRGEETPKTTASWIASSVDTRLRRQRARGTPGRGLSQPQREESGGRARRHCPSGSSRPGVGTARTAVRIDGDGRCSRATDRVATATSPPISAPRSLVWPLTFARSEKRQRAGGMVTTAATRAASAGTKSSPIEKPVATTKSPISVVAATTDLRNRYLLRARMASSGRTVTMTGTAAMAMMPMPSLSRRLWLLDEVVVCSALQAPLDTSATPDTERCKGAKRTTRAAIAASAPAMPTIVAARVRVVIEASVTSVGAGGLALGSPAATS